MTPARYVEAVRLERARHRARTTTAARRRRSPRHCGFGTADDDAPRRSSDGSASSPATTAPASSRRSRPPAVRRHHADRHPDLRQAHRARRVGPYEVLSRLPGAELEFVAKEAGPKRTDTGRLALIAERAIAESIRPTSTSSSSPAARATGRCSTTTRSRLGPRASTRQRVDDLGLHRLAGARRGRHPRRARGHHPLGLPRPARRVRRDAGRRARGRARARSITAAGVSSGIDMALTLVARDRGAGGGAGDPARHRVRPGAPVRRRLAREGADRRSSSSSAASRAQPA